MTTGDAPTNDATQKMLDELNAILTEKVNAELQIYYIGWYRLSVKLQPTTSGVV